MKTPPEPRARTLRQKHTQPSSKRSEPRRGKAPDVSDAGGSRRGGGPTRSNGGLTRSKLQLPILNNGNGHADHVDHMVHLDKGASAKFGCEQCGLCCTYLAIEIDGPTSVKRATELLWYLYHEHVSIYVNDDSWMVQFETTCRYLTPDRRCGVYATRPHICREFSEKECEVNTGDDGHTFFTTTAFMDYLKQTRPRVHSLVMKGFAPPAEPKSKSLHPFERRLRDVYVRRAAALSVPAKKSRSGSASADRL